MSSHATRRRPANACSEIFTPFNFRGSQIDIEEYLAQKVEEFRCPPGCPECREDEEAERQIATARERIRSG